MPVAIKPASPRPSSLTKMEDRKRPAISGADDIAPPSKRHQSVNGNKSKGDTGEQSEEHWIENYQKGAIWRAFQESKRDKAELEGRVDKLQTHVSVALICDILSSALTVPFRCYKKWNCSSTRHCQRHQDQQEHLNDKTKTLRERAEAVINRIATSRGQITPNIADLENRVNALLAQQKDYLIQLDRSQHENQQLSEDLNKKTLEWFKAERREKRLKSAQVQKLEKQFLANATQGGTAGENGAEAAALNGNAAETLLKLEEASAVLVKQKEQLETAQTDLAALQEENSTLKTQREGVSDEDYIRTDVFKAFKAQNEDLIKRINHLEATNKQLREESERLQFERQAFRSKLNDEAQTHIADLERQVEEREGDVTRLRAARDEWFAKASMLEASQKEEKTALQHIQELAGAKDDRITALELELQRVKPDEDRPMADADPAIDSLPVEELLTKYRKLQADLESINKELPALQQAYKRSMTLAQKKVMDFSALEDRVAAVLAEKQKVDSKYFAVRKDADFRDRELLALRNQNRKTSEIVTQLKEVEAQHRVLISNLEKQLSDLRMANANLAAEHKKMEANSVESIRRADAYKAQVNELANQIKAKDAATASTRERATSQESELERLKARVEFIKKEKEDWKRKD
ncbi:E3 ubiquitin-protein ligase BRE1 [Verticillium alfalfae VaMs.102]|uniref:E3 ubiquitin protein ligase n=1 Tax=Verticillium alfalfae (strain VaMs.102 / ATCC MYA-4576 / FGSC 10136) TaxID=526221 RepID=C9SDY0_VERA1|nr:E3 ubiquitin-protein ligase BRE1 [Verticillium alfalfae VaMs.102]EEY16466.1 E3 ubiquitin-protein ligase BRE1 [Verticillium alfalfae VaMs.102]